MEGLFCTTQGCNLHDYAVGTTWCTYQWEMERGGQGQIESVRSSPSTEEIVRDVLRYVLPEILAAIDDNPQRADRGSTPERKRSRGVNL